MTVYYKALGHGGAAYHGGTGIWRKNRWRAVKGELVPCENGLHLCRREHLVEWLATTIWEAEADETELIDHGDKIVVRRARIVRRLDTWNDRTARLFAADCAEHVLHLFENKNPGDDRPRRAIEAVRAYARGEIDAFVVAAARAARNARAAAGDAHGAAAGAAWNAWDAADAAWSAANAAWVVAAAARDAARKWQTDRLMEYLYPGERKEVPA